jgi:hypothetical protein
MNRFGEGERCLLVEFRWGSMGRELVLLVPAHFLKLDGAEAGFCIASVSGHSLSASSGGEMTESTWWNL